MQSGVLLVPGHCAQRRNVSQLIAGFIGEGLPHDVLFWNQNSHLTEQLPLQQNLTFKTAGSSTLSGFQVEHTNSTENRQLDSKDENLPLDWNAVEHCRAHALNRNTRWNPDSWFKYKVVCEELQERWRGSSVYYESHVAPQIVYCRIWNQSLHSSESQTTKQFCSFKVSKVS